MIAHINRVVHGLPCFVDPADDVEYVSEQARSFLCELCSDVVSRHVLAVAADGYKCSEVPLALAATTTR